MVVLKELIILINKYMNKKDIHKFLEYNEIIND